MFLLFNFSTELIPGQLSANLNIVKMMCNFRRMFTVNTDAVPALSYSGQVGYRGYLITIGL